MRTGGSIRGGFAQWMSTQSRSKSQIHIQADLADRENHEFRELYLPYIRIANAVVHQGVVDYMRYLSQVNGDFNCRRGKIARWYWGDDKFSLSWYCAMIGREVDYVRRKVAENWARVLKQRASYARKKHDRQQIAKFSRPKIVPLVRTAPRLAEEPAEVE